MAARVQQIYPAADMNAALEEESLGVQIARFALQQTAAPKLLAWLHDLDVQERKVRARLCACCLWCLAGAAAQACA